MPVNANDKLLQNSLAHLASLTRQPELDDEGQRAVQTALDTLAGYSGRTVAQGFVEWLRQGSMRRDPRPAPMRPLQGPTPLETGRMRGAFPARGGFSA